MTICQECDTKIASLDAEISGVKAQIWELNNTEDKV